MGSKLKKNFDKRFNLALFLLGILLILSAYIVIFIRANKEHVEKIDEYETVKIKETSFNPFYKNGNVYNIKRATVYNPSPGQTDDTPNITAFNDIIDLSNPDKHRYLAVSRDLLSEFSAGDTVFVYGTWVYDGYWIIADKMNKRYKRSIDFLIGDCQYQNRWSNIYLCKITYKFKQCSVMN
ncbi:MAG: hypothetical protein V3V33_16525 [Candidatus Lokiarchaeia archaeon]